MMRLRDIFAYGCILVIVVMVVAIPKARAATAKQVYQVEEHVDQQFGSELKHGGYRMKLLAWRSSQFKGVKLQITDMKIDTLMKMSKTDMAEYQALLQSMKNIVLHLTRDAKGRLATLTATVKGKQYNLMVNGRIGDATAVTKMAHQTGKKDVPSPVIVANTMLTDVVLDYPTDPQGGNLWTISTGRPASRKNASFSSTWTPTDYVAAGRDETGRIVYRAARTLTSDDPDKPGGKKESVSPLVMEGQFAVGKQGGDWVAEQSWQTWDYFKGIALAGQLKHKGPLSSDIWTHTQLRVTRIEPRSK